jgi:hypothetical protein
MRHHSTVQGIQNATHCYRPGCFEYTRAREPRRLSTTIGDPNLDERGFQSHRRCRDGYGRRPNMVVLRPSGTASGRRCESTRDRVASLGRHRTRRCVATCGRRYRDHGDHAHQPISYERGVARTRHVTLATSKYGLPESSSLRFGRQRLHVAAPNHRLCARWAVLVQLIKTRRLNFNLRRQLHGEG